MNAIVLIPARGGSKRVPFKNMRDLAGQPLINYTINFAKRIIKNDKIIVSSDNSEILSHSQSFGVRVLERPLEFSNDLSSTGQVLKHCIESFKKEGVDTVITLQPTNPFRSLNEFNAALQLYKSHEASSKSLCSISELNHKYGHVEKGCYVPENYSFGQRSQDLKKKYYENGQFYISSLDLAEQSQVLSTSPLAFICNNWFDMIDIDDPQDFKLADVLMKNSKDEFDFT